MLRKFLFILLFTAGLGTTGMSQDHFSTAQDHVRYYPNPASSFINFDMIHPGDRTQTLQIYNFLGKKVLEINNTSSRNFVSLENFYRGIYIFQLRDRNGKTIASGKFQVVK